MVIAVEAERTHEVNSERRMKIIHWAIIARSTLLSRHINVYRCGKELYVLGVVVTKDLSSRPGSLENSLLLLVTALLLAKEQMLLLI